MKILIADDTKLNRIGLSSFCKSRGYEVITAQNGLEAIERFQADSPDMILMDAMMPVMDGFEATRQIKNLCNGSWIPILMITALDKAENIKKGVASGADDYLTKPVNFTILGEKIKVMTRISAIQDELQGTMEKMKVYHDRTEEELNLATEILDRFSSSERINEQRLQHCILPAERVGGDLIAVAKTPGNSLNIILADGTGHGLAAAISVVPICQIFYSMTRQGHSLSTIVAELNDRLNLLLPVGYFVAATVISIDWGEESIQIWNGGAPPPVFITETGKRVEVWGKTRPALGILNKTQFNSHIEPFKLKEKGRLFFYSDGLLDVKNRTGEPFGKDRLYELLQSTQGLEGFNQIKSAVLEHLANRPAEDDISFVMIDCSKERGESLFTESRTGSQPKIKGGHWKYNLVLSEMEIKRIDLIPYLLTWLQQTGLPSPHCERLFIVLSELYNNALEHGVLGLDSAMKLSPSGFEDYLKLRETRLRELKKAVIEIHLERTVGETGDKLLIHLKDSGPGFYFKTPSKNGKADHKNPVGRGILLVKSLCENIKYQGSGNEVKVEYSLD